MNAGHTPIVRITACLMIMLSVIQPCQACSLPANYGGQEMGFSYVTTGSLAQLLYDSFASTDRDSPAVTEYDALQEACQKQWLSPTAVSDPDMRVTRGELYLSAFKAAGVPLYDATLYGLSKLPHGKNALRIGKELGLCDDDKQANELVRSDEAVALIRDILATDAKSRVIPPEIPVPLLNRDGCGLNDYLLELQKIPDSIKASFKRDGWTLVIDHAYIAGLGQRYGLNCIGATVYGEKRIYVSNPNAVLHEFGHYADLLFGCSSAHGGLYSQEAADAPMSAHAKSSGAEYFAEYFSMWLSGKTRTLKYLKEMTPLTYEYFTALADDWAS